MRTLTHGAVLAAFVVGIPALAIVTAAIVWVAVAIRTRLGRARPAEAGTESAALGATGPGVVSVVRPTPGPGPITGCVYCDQFGDEPHEDWCSRSLAHHIDTAAAPRVVRAVLTPDCPSLPDLTLEFWRCNPAEPLAPSEVVRWKDITKKYEWVAVPVVVPGRES